MSQSFEHLDEIIPGVTGEEFVAIREANRKVIENAGGCESDHPFYDSVMDDEHGDACMADIMEDLFSGMAENAANKDADGYSKLTEICSTVHELRRLRKLSETVRWFKIMPSSFKEKGHLSISLMVNPKLGSTVNAARLFSSEHVFHLNLYVTDWSRANLREYKYFKTMVQEAYDNKRPYRHLFEDFRTLRDSSLFTTSDTVYVPFMCDAVGFDQPQVLHEPYFLRGITFENDDLMFICENFEQAVSDDNGHCLFSHRIHFKDETLRCPRFVTVPADAIVYNMSKKWDSYIHSTMG